MKPSILCRLTLGLFCLVSAIYVGQLVVSVVLLTGRAGDQSMDFADQMLRLVSSVLVVVRSNPIPTFVLLTALAIWMRSGIAVWIHLAMFITAGASQLLGIYYLFYGFFSFQTILPLLFELGGLCLLLVLWRRGELVMRSKAMA